MQIVNTSHTEPDLSAHKKIKPDCIRHTIVLLVSHRNPISSHLKIDIDITAQQVTLLQNRVLHK